jgi:hypothetical protein
VRLPVTAYGRNRTNDPARWNVSLPSSAMARVCPVADVAKAAAAELDSHSENVDETRDGCVGRPVVGAQGQVGRHAREVPACLGYGPSRFETGRPASRQCLGQRAVAGEERIDGGVVVPEGHQPQSSELRSGTGCRVGPR